MTMSMKVNIAWGNETNTYLAGKNEYQEPMMIVTETWRFKKLCQEHNRLTLPFYIIQYDKGCLMLIATQQEQTI